jgi:hypothetical protein
VPDGTQYEAQVPEFPSIGYDEFPDSRVFFNSSSTNKAWNFLRGPGKIANKSGEDEPTHKNIRHLQQGHDRYLQIHIEVYGLSGLQVGDGIQLKVPKQGSQESSLKYDNRWTSTGAYYITKLVHKVDLRSGDPNYKMDLILSPKDAGRALLPSNGDHAGVSDKRQGKIEDFYSELERMQEAD